MIARLRGILEQRDPDCVIVDVQGVGYDVKVPETIRLRLPEVGQPVSLRIYTHVREDSLQLFGFLSALEKDVFEILLSVQGVGPKLAMAILSAQDARQILETAAQGNKTALTGISGVGKKTAERIVLDAREKCEKRLMLEQGGVAALAAGARVRGVLATSASPAEESAHPWARDLEAALIGLGYRDQEIRAVWPEIAAAASLEAALKQALQRLGQARGTAKPLRGTA